MEITAVEAYDRGSLITENEKADTVGQNQEQL